MTTPKRRILSFVFTVLYISFIVIIIIIIVIGHVEFPKYPKTGIFVSLRSKRFRLVSEQVEQYWHVSIKGLFHTEKSCGVRATYINFLWLLFILASKICPRMQENFLWLPLKRKALLSTK